MCNKIKKKPTEKPRRTEKSLLGGERIRPPAAFRKASSNASPNSGRRNRLKKKKKKTRREEETTVIAPFWITTYCTGLKSHLLAPRCVTPSRLELLLLAMLSCRHASLTGAQILEPPGNLLEQPPQPEFGSIAPPPSNPSLQRQAHSQNCEKKPGGWLRCNKAWPGIESQVPARLQIIVQE